MIGNKKQDKQTDMTIIKVNFNDISLFACNLTAVSCSRICYDKKSDDSQQNGNLAEKKFCFVMVECLFKFVRMCENC